MSKLTIEASTLAFPAIVSKIKDPIFVPTPDPDGFWFPDTKAT